MSACEDFRRRLAASLIGRPSPPAADVAWHEHLLGCEPCRALLAAEEALEAVLASLPAPELPAQLAERVLAGLDAAREAQELERRLDVLLERVPAPIVPAGLAQRVLAATQAPVARPRSVASRRMGWALGAAAAGLVAIFLWRMQRPDGGAETAPVRHIAETPPRIERNAAPGKINLLEADPELLAALDVLERWDLLCDEDLALLLASMDAVEEELLDLAYEEDEDEG
jgi:hypothetical protein